MVPIGLRCPSGAILSPMLLSIYMHPLAQLMQKFQLGCHQCTDGTQLYLLMDSQPALVPDMLSPRLEAVEGWLQLKLIPVKMEVQFMWGRNPIKVGI